MEVHVYSGRIFQKSLSFFLLKMLKCAAVIGHHFPLLSFSPYQISENLSQTQHVPLEEGLKGHESPCSNFNCLLQQYMVHQHISKSNYLCLNWRFISPWQANDRAHASFRNVLGYWQCRERLLSFTTFLKNRGHDWKKHTKIHLSSSGHTFFHFFK